MKKLEIEIPNNKEIDWEASAKQKQIVFKDKQLTYEDVCKKLFKNGYCYLDMYGNIQADGYNQRYINEPNNAKTSHQLECILAKNSLANVARYLNGDWGYSSHDKGWVIGHNPALGYNIIVRVEHYTDLSNVLFKTRALAEEAIKILGEETIKLALEPLY